MKIKKSDYIFYRTLFFIAMPIILQEILNSSVNMMDTFMIGRLGETAVASVGLANQIFFLFSLISFGINSGSAIFMGQYWGKRDIKSIHKVMGLSFSMSFFTALVFFIIVNVMPQTVMKIYSKDLAVIELGVKYLRIVGYSYFIMSFTLTINNALRVMGKTHFPMTTTFISLVANVIFNYIFIFMMKLGVQGAALGTLCARFIEISSIFLIVKIKKLPVYDNIKNYFSADLKFIKGFMAISAPVIINEGMWSLGVTIYNVAYKFSGTNAQASVQIVSTIQNLFMVLGMSIGAGAGIMIANSLGANDFKKAIRYSRKSLTISVLASVFMGIVLVLSSDFIISIFDVNEEVRMNCKYMLFIVAIGMCVKNFVYASIIGVLRSGGDTKFCLLVDVLGIWLIGVPLAFLGSYFLKLPIYYTFASVYMVEVVQSIVVLPRVLKNKWAKSVID